MGASFSKKAGRNEGMKQTLGRSRLSKGGSSFEATSQKTVVPRNSLKSKTIGGKMSQKSGGY